MGGKKAGWNDGQLLRKGNGICAGTDKCVSTPRFGSHGERHEVMTEAWVVLGRFSAED